jgi:hypothetical protein
LTKHTGNSADSAGAGVDIASVATYKGCTFDGNSTDETPEDNSGGAYLAGFGATVMMTECVFLDNSTPADGGGIAGLSAFVDLTDCQFMGNSGAQGGGVSGSAGSIFTMVGCRIEGNIASDVGGGVQFIDATATIVNTLFAMNHSDGVAGGLWIGAGEGKQADVTVVNSTFTQNSAVVGGAVMVDVNGTLSAGNSIFWGDDAGSEIAVAFPGEAIVTYSDVEGGWDGGTGNINKDPMFFDDSCLGAFSPCIDAADNTAVPEGVVTDLAGLPRFHDDPWTVDTGVPGGEGGAAIVDMGARELQGSSCPADCNGDLALNILDFVCFQGLFQAGDPSADCNGDGVLNVLDFVCFQGLFRAGCP